MRANRVLKKVQAGRSHIPEGNEFGNRCQASRRDASARAKIMMQKDITYLLPVVKSKVQ
jgi:hypothetical protein